MVFFGNIAYLPEAVSQIVLGAFDPAAVTGGAVGSFMIAVQMGVARGIFSNESGLGSAPIAVAAAKTSEPVRQGLVCMTGTFISIIVCSMTGLTIVMSGAWDPALGLEGSEITTYAFQMGIPFLPGKLVSFCVMLCLALFGFMTIVGWNYYSNRCVEYLCDSDMKVVRSFNWVYIFAVFVGPYMTIDVVWTFADIFNGCMAIPNMIALIMLSGVISGEVKDYFARLRAGEVVEFPSEAERLQPKGIEAVILTSLPGRMREALMLRSSQTEHAGELEWARPAGVSSWASEWKQAPRFLRSVASSCARSCGSSPWHNRIPDLVARPLSASAP